MQSSKVRSPRGLDYPDPRASTIQFAPKTQDQGEGGRKRSKKRIIRKIVRKRTSDGQFVPVEVVKTVIGRDGSRSVTREDPNKYASKVSLRFTSPETAYATNSMTIINKVGSEDGHGRANTNDASRAAPSAQS